MSDLTAAVKAIRTARDTYWLRRAYDEAMLAFGSDPDAKFEIEDAESMRAYELTPESFVDWDSP